MGNIIVAFSKPQDGRNIRNILVKHGIQVTASCTSGAQVLALTDDLRSGIVVSGYRFGDMACRQLADQLPPGFDLLLIASPESDRHRKGYFDGAEPDDGAGGAQISAEMQHGQPGQPY